MKVLVYPISDNPYQHLLYSKLPKHTKVKLLRSDFIDKNHAFVIGMPVFPLRFLYHRLKGWKILHLHWLLPFVFPSDKKIFTWLSTIYIVSFLFWVKLLKFKLVWTLHEIYPHKPEFINDIFIRKLVAKLSDATIYHTPASIDDAKKLGFSMDKLHTIPLGNYISSYENTLSKTESRKKLNIGKNDFVFLFFGLIKPYKGIDDLLPAFERLLKSNKNKNLKLVIAGPSEDEGISNQIKEYKKKLDKSLLTNIGFVEDDSVQIYVNSADVVVLPYKKNTSSAAALLAFGFKRPIIAPLLGSFKDFPSDSGIYYSEQGLLDAMQKAIDNKSKLTEMGKKGYEITRKLSWENIAQKTFEVYKKL